MILFLDDDVSRTKRFRSCYPSCSTAATSQEMIDLLSKLTETAEYVFLDHDLGGEIYVDSGREDCGMEVVRWMTEHKPPVNKVIVHSLNYGAAATMVSKLKDTGYDAVAIPFTALDLQ